MVNDQIRALSEDKLSAERVKTDTEQLETEAKQSFDDSWKKLQSENQTKMDQSLITKAFNELDIDNNEKYSYFPLNFSILCHFVKSIVRGTAEPSRV